MSLVEQRATLDDLYREPGKAELIAGRIVRLMPTGYFPNYVAGQIYVSLRDYRRRTQNGVAGTDNLGYAISPLPSGRESFSPDVSYCRGVSHSKQMRFITGPPTFAAEVRSENDYGEAAERNIAAKRADYFEAGTLVVWDVDPVDEAVHVYRASDPETPVTYRRGQEAEADPAVPGWRVSVDWLFD